MIRWTLLLGFSEILFIELEILNAIGLCIACNTSGMKSIIHPTNIMSIKVDVLNHNEAAKYDIDHSARWLAGREQWVPCNNLEQLASTSWSCVGSRWIWYCGCHGIIKACIVLEKWSNLTASWLLIIWVYHSSTSQCKKSPWKLTSLIYSNFPHCTFALSFVL